jgi:polyferredoxin
MMSVIKNIGLYLSLIAFLLFNATLFLDDYRLTDQLIDKVGMNELQQMIFKQNSERIINKTYTNKILFLKNLSNVFEQTNSEIIDQYSICESEIEKLITGKAEENITYSKQWAQSKFKNNDEISNAKLNAINDYTSWMDGREYKNIENLKSDLKNAITNYNNSIIYNQAFDDYKLNSLKFSMLKQSGSGLLTNNILLFFLLTFGLGILGALLFILPKFKEGTAGIKHNGIMHDPMNSRGWAGIIAGSFLILFYIVLYFFPVYIVEWVSLSEVFSQAVFGREASQWFLYGFLYTIAVIVMGLRFLTKYRGNRYQQYRTYSVMFFQLIIAFILPQILYALNLPEVDLKNIWPLDYSFFYEWRINAYLESGALGMVMLVFGIALIIIGVPLITYFLGKRWYCSWVCGCGGLAETAGDSYRQLSSKKLIAWQIERYLINAVLVFAVIMTAWVLYTYFTGSSKFLGIDSYQMRKIYGFLISSIFAGVVGTGFYPLMGNRVWCRFGCPMAAYLGMVQRFKSRFRITTNGGQCISCGNCSTYCEMGIDVRWYAQRGQNIVRSSCVGCGICAAVCPRGVLKLENASENNRLRGPNLLGNEGVINIREMRKKKGV